MNLYSLDHQKMSSLPGAVKQLLAEKARRSLHTFFQLYAWPILQSGVAFVDNWHIHAMCEHLEAVHSGQIKRLIINVPFRMLKSTIVSQAFPAWEWVSEPSTQYLTASYAKDLSTRDAVNSRRIIESYKYQSAFGSKFRMTSDQNVKTRYENDKGGSRTVISTDSSGTGFGGNRVIWDDPISALNADSETARDDAIEFWKGTLSTRLNDPMNDAFIIVHQRLNPGDATGYVLANETELGWEHLILPMRYDPKIISISSIGYKDPRKREGELLFPKRLDEPTVKSLETTLGSYHTSAQLQQSPTQRSGRVYLTEKITIIDKLPARVSSSARYWDKAGTEGGGCFTAGVLMYRLTDGKYVIAHCNKGQWGAGKREDRIKQQAMADGHSVRVFVEQEPGSGGKDSALSTVSNLAGFAAYADLPGAEGSKLKRADPLAAQMEAGNVYMIRGDWNQPMIDEMDSFPDGKYKDQCDAANGAFVKVSDNLLDWDKLTRM